MGIGPVPAVKKLLARLNLRIDDMDLVELNEAFTCQVLSVLKGWEWQDQDAIAHKLNVNGSSLAAGHPFAATGGRIVASLAKTPAAKGPGPRGLISICAAGGLR